MGFADILKTFKNASPNTGGDIIGKIDRYLISLKGKPFLEKENDREQGVYHPSELTTNKCTRALVYKWLKTPVSNPNNNDPKGRRIFDVGHHFGYILQGYFWDMGILEGNWECVVCRHKWWDLSPKTCPNCGRKLFIWDNLKYLEVPVRNKKWNVAGHADGIVHLDGERVVIELKSIKNRDVKTSEKAVTFEDLNQAKIEHVGQANLYIDGLNEMGHDDIKAGRIIYFAKNTQELKAFPITKMNEILNPLYLKIDLVNRSLESRTLPERAGRIKSDPICRYCPFKNYCWDNDYTFEESDYRNR